MDKFRKWFFKFLTGYELIKYVDVLNLAKEIHELNIKLNKESEETLSLVKEANERYKKLLETSNE